MIKYVVFLGILMVSCAKAQVDSAQETPKSERRSILDSNPTAKENFNMNTGIIGANNVDTLPVFPECTEVVQFKEESYECFKQILMDKLHEVWKDKEFDFSYFPTTTGNYRLVVNKLGKFEKLEFFGSTEVQEKALELLELATAEFNAEENALLPARKYDRDVNVFLVIPVDFKEFSAPKSF